MYLSYQAFGMDPSNKKPLKMIVINSIYFVIHFMVTLVANFSWFNKKLLFGEKKYSKLIIILVFLLVLFMILVYGLICYLLLKIYLKRKHIS